MRPVVQSVVPSQGRMSLLAVLFAVVTDSVSVRGLRGGLGNQLRRSRIVRPVVVSVVAVLMV